MSEWLESLPEPLRNAPFLGKSESAEDAIGKLAHAAQLVGQSVRIPQDDATDEQRAEFYQKLEEVPGVARLPTPDDVEGLNGLMSKLGRPEKAEDYLPPELENFEWDADMLTDLKSYAFESAMTNAQFKTFAEKIASQEQRAATDTETARQEQRDALKTEWGEALGDRETMVKNWLEASGAPEAMRDLLESQNLTAESMKWLYSTAHQFMGDANPVRQDGAEAVPAVTREQATAKIQEILANPAYFDAADPRQKDLMAQMTKYQTIANGIKAA